MHGLTLERRICGDLVVVALRGELDMASSASAAAALAALTAAGRRIVVDLGGLTFADCHCLRTLEHARQRARQAGGDVLLAAPRGLVARLLTLTSMGEALDVHATVAAALASAAARTAVPAGRAPRAAPLGAGGPAMPQEMPAPARG